MKSLIITKYYGPTDFKGARIRCHSWKGKTWHGYNYAGMPHATAAKEHAAKFGLPTPEPVLSPNEKGEAFIA